MHPTPTLHYLRAEEIFRQKIDHLPKVPGLPLHQLPGTEIINILHHLRCQQAGGANAMLKPQPGIIRMAVQASCILINHPSQLTEGLDEQAERRLI
jgi:hypothetical protein